MLNDHPSHLDQQRYISWPLALTSFILCAILIGATQVYAESDAAVLSSTDEMQAGNEFNDRSALRALRSTTPTVPPATLVKSTKHRIKPGWK
jgi:hypothetical protein